MALRMIGSDFKRFFHDEAYWGEGTWYDDAVVDIDGEECGDRDVMKIPDGAKVVIAGGVVFDKDDNDVCSFETFARRWVKAQTTVAFVVEVEKTRETELRDAIAAHGGTIK